MCQSTPLYAVPSAVQMIDSWIRTHVPVCDETTLRRFIQLVTGVFEQQSILIEAIARSTAFQAPGMGSNETQVRRILRDESITLKTIYYPMLQSLLSDLSTKTIYLAIDETTHTQRYGLFQIGLITDGISIPLGFFQYDINEPWSDEARAILETIDAAIPEHFEIILLADRIHTGEPFLSCLDALEWDYIFRASENTCIETEHGWKTLKSLAPPAHTGLFLTQVRIWKGSTRSTNVSIHTQADDALRSTTWYLVSSLPACQQRCTDYACRWWQECTFKVMKSGLFHWERGRVTDPARVEVLWMAMSCAIWAMWMLGRAHEHIPQRKPTTERPQKRRKSIIKQGIAAFYTLCKQGIAIVLIMPHRLGMCDDDDTHHVPSRSSPESDGTMVEMR